MAGLRDQLLAIRDANGGQLTPEAVVTAARPTDHPLHSRIFDRTPREAAEAWYRHRAHELIQSVRVAYIADDKPKDIRAFVAVPEDEGPNPTYVYEPVEEALMDDKTRQLVLSRMEREWRSLHARYGDMAEFAALVRESLGAAA